MFGFNKPFAGSTFGTTTQSVFGAPQQQQQQQQSTSLFGSAGAKPSVSFGQTTGATTGLFGTPTTTATGTTSLFGGSLFGTSAAAAPASTNLFGAHTAASAAPSTFQTGSSLFNFTGTPVAAVQPVQTGGSLFGTGSPATSNLFGSSATTMNQQIAVGGTTVKFNPLLGQDQMMKNGIQTTVNTRHQCISSMKEYEIKALEELRIEDYLANRKGPQQQTLAFGAQPAQQTTGLFGATQQTSLFGTPATTSAGPTGGLFGTTGTTGGLFGSTQPAGSLFGASTSTAPGAAQTGFSFGATAAPVAGTGLFGSTQPGTGLFGATQPQQTTGLFGATAQPTASTGGSLFGGSTFQFGKTTQAPTTGLFGTGQQTLFGQAATSTAAPSTGFTFGGAPTNTVAPFGVSTGGATGAGLFGTQQPTAAVAPTFGTGGGLFGQTSQQPSAFGTQATSAFSFGGQQQPAATGGGLFGSATQQVKPFGTTSSGLFGQPATSAAPALGFGAPTGGLFGAQVAKPTGFSFGSTAPASTGFGTNQFGVSSVQQPIAIGTDPATMAAQNSLIQCHLKAMAQSPYGDSKLLHLLKGKTIAEPSRNDFYDSKSTINQNIMSPSMGMSSQLFNSPYMSPLGSKPLPPAKASPRIFNVTVNLNASQDRKSLLGGLDNDTLTFSEGYVPKRNIKKLILGKMDDRTKRQSLCMSTTTQNVDGGKSLFNDDHALTVLKSKLESQTNDNSARQKSSSIDQVVSPIYAYPRKSDLDSLVTRLYPSLEDSTVESRRTSSIGTVTQQGSAPLQERVISVDEIDQNMETKPEKPNPHPANIVCTRSDYYTEPELDELGAVVGPDGSCVVNNGFTIGRTGYGSVFWPGVVDVSNLDIDAIVHFRHKEVTVYPDEETKPSVGKGLNRKAEVTLERVWPNDKTTHLPIQDVKRLELIRFKEKLEKASAVMGAEFVDYRPDTGSWVFRVNHFSKYGLLDDDDDQIMPDSMGTDALKNQATIGKVQRLGVDKLLKSSMPDQALEIELTDYNQTENTMGLGGISVLDAKDALGEDIELSADEPSFLVKSDNMGSFMAGFQDESVLKLRQHLFYDGSTSPHLKNLAEEQNQAKKIRKTDQMSELYERSVSLLEKKSFSKALKGDYSIYDEKTSLLFLDQQQKSETGHSFMEQKAPTLQLIQPKHQFRLVDFEKSILSKVLRSLAPVDSSAFNNRRSRIGFSFDGRIFSPGSSMGLAPQSDFNSSIYTSLPIDNKSALSVNICQPCTSSDEENIILIETLLETQLLCSVRYNRTEAPHFVPMNPSETIDNYGKAIVSLAEENAGNLPLDFTLISRVFGLCEALWGKQEPASNYVQDSKRKEALGKWISEVCEVKVESKLQQLEKQDKAQSTEAVLNLISVGKLNEAANLALKNRDPRLAISIGQLGSQESTKSLYLKQLSQWHESQADRYIDLDRLKLYTLFAGCVEWKTSDNRKINPFESIDWKRSLFQTLWYCSPSNFTIVDCVKLFDSLWNEFGTGLCQEPKPDYDCNAENVNNDISMECGRKEKCKERDLCYHLIKLFAERSYNVAKTLNNRNWTPDDLSIYLSWHLWCVLNSLGYTADLHERASSALHVQYANQLDRSGLWWWAVFVLGHISDDQERERSIKNLLARRVPKASEDRLTFLRKDLSIPSRWIHEALALKAHADGNYLDEFLCSIQAENYNHAHRLFLQHVGPVLVVDEKIDDLKTYLDALVIKQERIEQWETGGEIYCDHLRLKAEYELMKQFQDDIADQDLERMKDLATSLASRVKHLKCSTPLQRLCQSEMSFLIAQSIRLTCSDEEYFQLGSLISDLPIPDDFLLEEMQRLAATKIDLTDKIMFERLARN